MRIRSASWSLAVLLTFGSVALGYAAQDQAAKPKAKPVAAKSSATKAHSTKSSKKHIVTVRAQTAPTAQRISEIQSALAKEGSYQGDATGKWDVATVEAMRQFQAAHGLSPTGKLDARTLQKLGFGSDVAGRGAPLPQPGPEASAQGNSGEAQLP
jgi:peptidoglycan hydrolase-like protein with peptidoglycan-binding domain